MKYRKQILTAVFAALLLLYCGDWLLESALMGPLNEARKKTTLLEQRIEKWETALARARNDRKRLTAWEAQSLPSDVGQARSLYQGWLLELVKHVGLAGQRVDSSPPVTRRGGYRVLSFSLYGRGTLRQLTTLLFEFYRAGHLHQIRSLVIAPVSRTDLFDLSLSIEAVSLPGADRNDRLCPETSDRLAELDPAYYRVIVDRNLFSIGGSPDVIQFTRLTGVIRDRGEAEAWFSLLANGKILKLRKGENLEVGQFVGRIAEIEGSDVIVESDGQRWLLTIGDSLSEACALPPEY